MCDGSQLGNRSRRPSSLVRYIAHESCKPRPETDRQGDSDHHTREVLPVGESEMQNAYQKMLNLLVVYSDIYVVTCLLPITCIFS